MSTTQVDEKAVFDAAREIADAQARESYLQRACREDFRKLVETAEAGRR